MTRRAATLLLWIACAAGCAAQNIKAPTIDQSLEMRSVSSPKIAPDGRHVVYEESRTNWEADAFENDLWLADVVTGESHLLTTAAKSSTDAAWSQDGKWIAFLSDRVAPLAGSPAGKRQLYVMPANGGEAQQMTKMENGVSSFEWAPDSKRIGLAAEAPESKAMKDRKETFGDYHVIHADYQMAHLWVLDLPTTDAAGRTSAPAEPRLLTAGEDFSVGSYSWAPDGARIAFSAQRDPDLISGFSSDIYTVVVADGTVKKIVDTPAPDNDPKWSPDGKQIAYVTAGGSEYFFYTNRHIAVVPAEGGAPRVLTTSFDEDTNLLRWGPEGIYFSALQKTSSGLFVLDAKTGMVQRINLPGTDNASAFSFSKDFKSVAYRGAGPNQ